MNDDYSPMYSPRALTAEERAELDAHPLTAEQLARLDALGNRLLLLYLCRKNNSLRPIFDDLKCTLTCEYLSRQTETLSRRIREMDEELTQVTQESAEFEDESVNNNSTDLGRNNSINRIKNRMKKKISKTLANISKGFGSLLPNGIVNRRAVDPLLPEEETTSVNPPGPAAVTNNGLDPAILATAPKKITFVNLCLDPTMATAQLYYESTPWGNIGHADPNITVTSYYGHRWFIVVDGVYTKMFTVGDDIQQTFII